MHVYPSVNAGKMSKKEGKYKNNRDKLHLRDKLDLPATPNIYMKYPMSELSVYCYIFQLVTRGYSQSAKRISPETPTSRNMLTAIRCHKCSILIRQKLIRKIMILW